VTDEASIRWEYGTSVIAPRSGLTPVGGQIVKRRIEREVSLSRSDNPTLLTLSDAYWHCPCCATPLRVSSVDVVRTTLLTAAANKKAADVATEIC